MKITPEIVRELLHYDPETGIFTWRERETRRFKRERDRIAWNAKHADKRAGGVWTSQKNGYQSRRIWLLGRFYGEHQLAWVWMTGEPLPPQIDHRNRDATDNRWSNLRPSNYSGNGRNQSKRRNSLSASSGVSWFKSSGKWRAQCGVDGKNHHLGLFDDPEEAAEVVRDFRAKHGFDPNHGTELARYHTH